MPKKRCDITQVARSRSGLHRWEGHSVESFDEMCLDRVTIIKKGGGQFGPIKARVQNRGPKVFIPDATIPVEEGDQIVRHLSDDTSEFFVVEDRGFCPATEGTRAHYQARVRRQ